MTGSISYTKQPTCVTQKYTSPCLVSEQINSCGNACQLCLEVSNFNLGLARAIMFTEIFVGFLSPLGKCSDTALVQHS
jgi:hypothetical protein